MTANLPFSMQIAQEPICATSAILFTGILIFGGILGYILIDIYNNMRNIKMGMGKMNIDIKLQDQAIQRLDRIVEKFETSTEMFHNSVSRLDKTISIIEDRMQRKN